MNKGNLLIVDDEMNIVENLKYILKEHAENIFCAHNGFEALEIIAKENIHCVVCDIRMPKMNGVQLIERVRKTNNDVPFIFYSGHGNLDLMKEVAQYGAFDFLDKPNLDGLTSVISLGLKEGFNRANGLKENWEAVESEFAKMLKGI